MKCTYHAALALIASNLAVLIACSSGSAGTAQSASTSPRPVPVLDSWQTGLSGRYARVVETASTEPVSTWPAAGLTDTSGGSPLPTYSDVQKISHSEQFVYVDASGLASHQMGPWYWNVSTVFGNWPRSQGFVYKLPKHPVELPDGDRKPAGLGPQGAWVNGVAFFNQLDGAYFDTARQIEVQGGAAMGPNFGAEPNRLWVRDAIPVEGPTFDASNAHQPPIGAYHYHSNPLALRMQLGDNVKWDAALQKYVEDTSRLHHSPILGWARDGYPIYGPYGYGNCRGSGSEVRRMRSGFALRDGSRGTADLRVTGRKSIGKWAAQLHALAAPADGQGRVAISPATYGPDVSNYFYLGRYNEDYEFLSDQGKPGDGADRDFDLDRHNGRYCVTPDFPDGTYAYFVTVGEDGLAAYPYTVGRQFRGDPSGDVIRAAITETVKVHRVGLPLSQVAFQIVLDTPSKRILRWPSAEGVTYSVEASADGLNWMALTPEIRSATPTPGRLPAGEGYYSLVPLTTSFTDERAVASTPQYRVRLVRTAPHATQAAPATKGATTAIKPAQLRRGQSIRLEVTLAGGQPITDYDPLASITPAVELVTVDGATVLATGANVSRQLTKINADFVVPAQAAPGTYMVRLRFAGLPPPAMSLQGQYQSVGQLTGVAGTAIAAGLSYGDQAVKVD